MKPEQKLKCPSCPGRPYIQEVIRGKVRAYVWAEYKIVCYCGRTQSTAYGIRENAITAWENGTDIGSIENDYKEWP